MCVRVCVCVCAGDARMECVTAHYVCIILHVYSHVSMCLHNIILIFLFFLIFFMFFRRSSLFRIAHYVDSSACEYIDNLFIVLINIKINCLVYSLVFSLSCIFMYFFCLFMYKLQASRGSNYFFIFILEAREALASS